ncbi:MAG: DUF2726 domain-containing protein [Oscillospiraceae bacterium]
MLTIVIIITILLIIKICEYKKKQENEYIKYKLNENHQITDTIKEKKLPYKRKYLLTKNELAFYKALKPIADKLNYSILAKTRVADLVEVKSGINKSDWQTAFNKINKKHIDFILCDSENLMPILLIELDDNSHNDEKTIKRDMFIEKLYEETGYKLLRVIGINDLENKIKEKII